MRPFDNTHPVIEKKKLSARCKRKMPGRETTAMYSAADYRYNKNSNRDKRASERVVRVHCSTEIGKLVS